MIIKIKKNKEKNMKNKKNIPYLYFRIRKTYGKIVNTGILQKEVDSFLKNH